LNQSHYILNTCHVNSNCQRVFPVICIVNFFMKIANGLIGKKYNFAIYYFDNLICNYNGNSC
jgi:hypothetical protein